MDPEVVSDGPGACPICGMALEPAVATGDEGNPELDDMQRRFRWALVFTVPLFFFEMGAMLAPALRDAIPPRLNLLVQLLLATPVVLWCGKPFFERAWLSLKTRNFNMFTLIGLGTGAAYLYSLVRTAQALFPFQRNSSLPPSSSFPGPRRLLRGRRGHRHARPARAGARAPRPREDFRRDPRAARPRAGDGARRARGERGRRPARRGDEGRRPARAPRRPGSGGRRRDGGRERRRRVDALGRADAGREIARGEGHRRDPERRRELPHARRARGDGHGARADRRPRRRGAAQPRPRPAPRGPRRGHLRAGGRRGGGGHRARLGLLRAGAAAPARARERRGGPHHRVPVRPRPRDADVRHGRDRTRREERRALPRRGGAGNPGPVRHARPRQDGHAHGGEAEDRGDARLRRLRRKGIAAAGRFAGTGERAPPRGGRHGRGARRGASLALSPSKEFSSVPGKGIHGNVDGRTVQLGSLSYSKKIFSSVSRADRWRQQRPGGARARRSCSWPSTGSPPDSSPPPTR